MVMGTYMHGVFDLPSFREFFLSKARAIEMGGRREDSASSVERSLQRLAEAVESSVDLAFIWEDET
jgi:adenosylcobyric acid synthase